MSHKQNARTGKQRVVGLWALAGLAIGMASAQAAEAPLFHDSHFHLTNYVQQGTDLRKYVDEIMGDAVGRSTLFGIPLQQQWSYAPGDFAPTYYLDTDAPLYYYSFTDAQIARAYRRCPRPAGALRSDDHRLQPRRHVRGGPHPPRAAGYPGVFTGIGEFTIHKEFVSSKIAGDVASLTDPALDRILDFAAEVGLVVILHNDIDMPVREDGRRAGVRHSDPRPSAAASPHHDHLGAHRRGPRGPSRAGHPARRGTHHHSSRGRGGDSDRPRPQSRQFRHLLGSGREVRDRIAGTEHAPRRFSTVTPIASCSAPTTWHRRPGGAIACLQSLGAGVVKADTRNEFQGPP